MRISVLGATLVALLGSTALVSAQQGATPGAGGGEPSMKQQGGAPGAGAGSDRAPQRAPGGEDAAGSKGEGPRAKGPGSDSGKSSARSGADDRGSARAEKQDKQDRQDRKGTAQSDSDRKGKTAQDKDRSDERRGKSAQSQDRDSDRAKQKAAEGKGKADDQKSARGKDREDRNERAAQSKDRDRGDRKQDQAQGRDNQGRDNQGREQAQDRDRNRQGQHQASRADLNQEQRTRIHTTLSKHREARVTNVNFTVNVGTRVPTRVRTHLHVLPQDIVTIVPQYRGYRYFVVEDRICIVEPRTYEIVEVIDTGPRQGRAVRASLDLTQSQIAFILDHVPMERHRADVRVDLALGADVPGSVELYEFPEDVIAEVPAIRDYRYVVVDRRIVIVNPSDRDVIRIIDR